MPRANLYFNMRGIQMYRPRVYEAVSDGHCQGLTPFLKIECLF